MLETAAALTTNWAAEAAVRRLRDVYRRLQAYGVAERVTLDLGEVRGMDYYTGVTFEVFAPGSGYAIAHGGRYDELLGRFGADRPAVGYAIELERVMLVLEQEGGSEPPLRPAALIQSCAHPACLASMQARRAAGEMVELDVMGRTLAELQSEAARRGIGAVIACLQEGG